MDAAKVRKEFPIFDQPREGRRLIYLDSAATSQKPRSVLRAEEEFYARLNSNVHRGVYKLSEDATEAYEQSRARVARFLRAKRPEEVVFLRGTTEALNLLAYTLGSSRCRRGDRVVATVSDHHSNVVPWHLLRERQGVDLEYVGVDDDGRLRTEEYDRWLDDGKTRIVTLPHVSNVLGRVNPIREIAERAHARGALVVVDAAQSAPHLALDVERLGADFLAFSGHKTLGPTGIGALWGRSELWEALPPWMGGGSMIEEVRPDRVTYREPPARFEAGTPNIAGAIGLSAALDFLEGIGWEEIAEHEHRLQARALELAHERFADRMTVLGPREALERVAVFSFAFRGAHPHDIATLLDAEGIAVRAGRHCSQLLMERFGFGATTRASPYVYNTREEIDLLFEGLGKVAKLFPN